MITKRDTIIGTAFALGAAMAYGTTSVLVRKGLVGLAPPLVGAAVALLFGTLVLAIIWTGSPESDLRQKKKPVGFLLIAGVAGGLGIAANYSALSMSPVVIVNPLANTVPLFTLLLSRLFLGRLERITPRVVLGAILIVVGATIIVIGRVD